MSGASAEISAAFSGRLGSFVLDAAFTAPMSGVTAFFGPSGCGKTTILRCIAGLERLGGRLNVGGDVWQDETTRKFCPAHKRSVGYVFQEPSLFPQLSVHGNLLYGAHRATRQGIRPAIGEAEVIALLGIAPLLNRNPHALSGGERQRVAIGRALLSQPRLLLMDEPLAALDRMTRQEILPYLERIHAALSLPILYVSHDLAEVERLADRLVLIEAGRVLAEGPLHELEADPKLPLLRLPDASVTLHGTVATIEERYALTHLEVPGGLLAVPGRYGAPGEPRRLRISASDVSFTLGRPERTTILNCLPAQILSVSEHPNGGAQINIVAGLGRDGQGARIAARITRKSQETLGLRPGLEVYAQIKSVALLTSGA